MVARKLNLIKRVNLESRKRGTLYRFTLIFLLVSTFSLSQHLNGLTLNKGKWHSELQLTEKDVLPFDLVITKSKGNYRFSVMNGEEEIPLASASVKNDSVHVPFSVFNSELVFSVKNKKIIEGWWYNYNKGKNYRIAFSAIKQKTKRFTSTVNNKTKNAPEISGKWEITFEPNTNSSYPAVGLFQQSKSTIPGTFLTETGDYRYLAGNTINDSLFLSCFDGSHAFLFKAAFNDGTLDGKFFSGNHWQSLWIGKKNNSFELGDPEKLTYLKENHAFNFNLPDLDGDTLIFPNEDYKNKVVIIQIMGSWCPNCLDETRYFKELYSKYHDRGLEIISIGYETGSSFDDFKRNIERLKNTLELDFTFLIGGKASKGLAKEHFSMLNNIISFPTTVFIGRDGEVKSVHTGFSGPGTGEYYTEYVNKTNALIESLLAN
jgi:thiol-disulfide isomerase/thioredoxin